MDLIAKYSDVGSLPVESRSRFLPRTGEIDLAVGGHYSVAGVGLFEGELCVLTTDDSGEPTWYPGALFDMDDSAVPGHWIARLFGEKDAEGGGWTFRLGYPELVDSLAHVNGVMEGDPTAMEAHYLEAGTITPPQT